MKQLLEYPRPVLAFFWSLVAALLLAFIVYRYGAKTEILTLVLGLLGGTVVGGIFGYYYSATHNAKPSIQQTADTITNSPAAGDSQQQQP